MLSVHSFSHLTHNVHHFLKQTNNNLTFSLLMTSRCICQLDVNQLKSSKKIASLKVLRVASGRDALDCDVKRICKDFFCCCFFGQCRNSGEWPLRKREKVLVNTMVQWGEFVENFRCPWSFKSIYNRVHHRYMNTAATSKSVCLVHQLSPLQTSLFSLSLSLLCHCLQNILIYHAAGLDHLTQKSDFYRHKFDFGIIGFLVQ